MRQEMKLAMARGDSDDVILAGFVGKYGPTVLSAPTTTGFNRVAWIMPVVIFIAALVAVILVVRAWKNRTPRNPLNPGSSAPEELDEFRRRAREETAL
jgi:cytochrome c-type biogenesis protein CcmH/NrfF